MGRGQNVIIDGSLEEADSSPHGDSEGSQLLWRIVTADVGELAGGRQPEWGLTVTELLPPHESMNGEDFLIDQQRET